MAKCKDEKIGLGGNPGQPSLKIPLGSIKQILSTLQSVFGLPDIPLPVITAKELSIGARSRSGISRIDTTARIISRCAAQGMDIGPAEDGSENISIKAKKIMADEIMRELQTKSKVEIVIPEGAIVLSTPIDGVLSVTPAGAVVGTLSNINPITAEVKGYGILR